MSNQPPLPRATSRSLGNVRKNQHARYLENRSTSLVRRLMHQDVHTQSISPAISSRISPSQTDAQALINVKQPDSGDLDDWTGAIGMDADAGRTWPCDDTAEAFPTFISDACFMPHC